MAIYSKKAEEKIEEVMHEFKEGTLKSGKNGKNGKVTNRKQAIAIGISEAKEAGLIVSDQKYANHTHPEKTMKSKSHSSNHEERQELADKLNKLDRAFAAKKLSDQDYLMWKLVYSKVVVERDIEAEKRERDFEYSF